MLRIAIVCCVLAGSASIAAAGACLDESEIEQELNILEQAAKDPKAKLPPWLVCLDTVPERYPKLGKRTVAVCEKVLARDPKYAPCIEVPAHLGHKQLGGVDFYEVLAARKIDPWDWTYLDRTVFLLGKIGDPRAGAVIAGVWEANLEEADRREKTKKRATWMMRWAGWRQDAARALATSAERPRSRFSRSRRRRPRTGSSARRASTRSRRSTSAAKPAAP